MQCEASTQTTPVCGRSDTSGGNSPSSYRGGVIHRSGVHAENRDEEANLLVAHERRIFHFMLVREVEANCLPIDLARSRLARSRCPLDLARSRYPLPVARSRESPESPHPLIEEDGIITKEAA